MDRVPIGDIAGSRKGKRVAAAVMSARGAQGARPDKKGVGRTNLSDPQNYITWLITRIIKREYSATPPPISTMGQFLKTVAEAMERIW